MPRQNDPHATIQECNELREDVDYAGVACEFKSVSLINRPSTTTDSFKKVLV
jgi:hypothetical protein